MKYTVLTPTHGDSNAGGAYYVEEVDADSHRDAVVLVASKRNTVGDFLVASGSAMRFRVQQKTVFFTDDLAFEASREGKSGS